MDGIRLFNKDIISQNEFEKTLPSKTIDKESFQNSLQDAIQKVNDLQMKADKASQDLATGRTDNVADVMIAAEKADIALRLMMQVRNKMIEGYQEIMKMQV